MFGTAIQPNRAGAVNRNVAKASPMERKSLIDEVLGEVSFVGQEDDELDEWQAVLAECNPSVQFEFMVGRNQTPKHLLPKAKRMLKQITTRWPALRQDAVRMICRVWNSQINRPKDEQVSEAEISDALEEPIIVSLLAAGGWFRMWRVYVNLDWATEDIVVFPVKWFGHPVEALDCTRLLQSFTQQTTHRRLTHIPASGFAAGSNHGRPRLQRR